MMKIVSKVYRDTETIAAKETHHPPSLLVRTCSPSWWVGGWTWHGVLAVRVDEPMKCELRRITTWLSSSYVQSKVFSCNVTNHRPQQSTTTEDEDPHFVRKKPPNNVIVHARLTPGITYHPPTLQNAPFISRSQNQETPRRSAPTTYFYTQNG